MFVSLFGDQVFTAQRSFTSISLLVLAHLSLFSGSRGPNVSQKKFFGWPLLVDRLNTRNILRRRKKRFEEGYM